jgi:GNAT superfamily N-acetyltransferase
VSVEGLERVAALGWRAPVEERLGGWLLRAAEGFTGRANSALALGDPGLPLAAAVERVLDWYGARGLRAMIAVPFPMAGPGGSLVDGYLEGQGWTLRSGPAVVMTGEAAEIGADGGGAELAAEPGGAGGIGAGEGTVEVAAEPGEEWLGRYHYRGMALPPVARRLLVSAPWQAFGSVREEGRVVAIGRVAGGKGWAAIEPDPGHRRRGLGTAVTRALAAAAAERGLTGLYLQVEGDNGAARALYGRLGFADHHRYHYRLAPEGYQTEPGRQSQTSWPDRSRGADTGRT